jgi:hypothetical protein
MKKIKIDGKIQKYRKWLDYIMGKEFTIRKEANQMPSNKTIHNVLEIVSNYIGND